MRILFTGGSSFTGLWFIRELARAGHEVVAVFRRRPEDYADPLRRQRVALALEHCEGAFGCSFGDLRFLELVRGRGWELLCHHAAEVTDYKSPDFDVLAAVRNNSQNVAAVLGALRESSSGQGRLLLTGSMFEQDESAGSEGLPAFSPYGLSKGLTYQVFRYYAGRAGVPLDKFVIPNPFGPYEDPRFTAYLMKCWFAGKAAVVNTPAYVRDNIHVSLLARVYAHFVAGSAERPLGGILRPSGYPEAQGVFAMRFAREMRSRLDLPCAVELKEQTEFAEPRMRVNTDLVDAVALGWDESGAWDEIAGYYEGVLRGPLDAAVR